MEKNEVKKYLYRNKELKAVFNYYLAGKLYYSVQLEDGVYQFPINTVEVDYIDNPNDPEADKIEVVTGLSTDLGITPFEREVKASLLNRWIDKAIDKQIFVKL